MIVVYVGFEFFRNGFESFRAVKLGFELIRKGFKYFGFLSFF